MKQPRKHPTAEKAEAIKDALKHFEVIYLICNSLFRFVRFGSLGNIIKRHFSLTLEGS